MLGCSLYPPQGFSIKERGNCLLIPDTHRSSMQTVGLSLLTLPLRQWVSGFHVPHTHLESSQRHRLTRMRFLAGLSRTQEFSSFQDPCDSATAGSARHCESLGYKSALSDLCFSSLTTEPPFVPCYAHLSLCYSCLLL